MLRRRVADVGADRETLLEFHCRINYESDSPWARRMPYEQYREGWRSSGQPESFLTDLAASMEDERTIAEVWEDDGSVIGYLWVTFTDVRDYGLAIAYVRDIAVTSSHQRRGVAQKMLEHVEELARARGARLLRSDTGIENVASERLHTKFGFKPYHIQYEKLLVDEITRSEA